MHESLFPKIMDLLLDTICVVDAEGRFVFVSASAEQLLGYRPEELVGRQMIELVHPDDRERTLEAAARIMGGQPRMHFRNRYIRKDGRVVHIMWSARWSEADRLRLAVARDVTPLKRAEDTREALYRISEAAYAGGDLPDLCRQVHRVIGELLPAQDFCVALYARDAGVLEYPYRAGLWRAEELPESPEPGTPLARVIDSARPVLAFRQGDGADAGEGRPDWLGVPLGGARGVIGALVIREGSGRGYGEEDRELLEFVSGQITTAIERKQNEERLLHMAGHDPLTDLPNRTLFLDRLDVALSRAHRDNELLALLYLDLDGFKHINDTCGHETGDLVLRELARRMAGVLRESDTVARLGGDEFTILLTNIRNADSVARVLDKLRAALAPPVPTEAGRLSVSASIGHAVYPEHGTSAGELLRRADLEMYRQKNAARQKSGAAD